MTEYIEWLRILIQNHHSFEYVIIFLGVAFGGEFALFAIGFLAAQNVVSFLPAIILSFFGAFLPNILWFFMGKTKTVSKIFLSRYANSTNSIIGQAMDRMSKDSYVIALILIKFMIGTPFFLITYINKTGLAFKDFLYYETPAIVLSLAFNVFIGFIAGLGFLYISDVFNNLYAAFGFILMVVLVVFMIKFWFKSRFTRNS